MLVGIYATQSNCIDIFDFSATHPRGPSANETGGGLSANATGMYRERRKQTGRCQKQKLKRKPKKKFDRTTQNKNRTETTAGARARLATISRVARGW